MPTQNPHSPSPNYRRPRAIIVRFDLALRNRSRKFCDPRQLLLPLQKVFTAGTRVAHALPRAIDAYSRRFTQLVTHWHRRYACHPAYSFGPGLYAWVAHLHALSRSYATPAFRPCAHQ